MITDLNYFIRSIKAKANNAIKNAEAKAVFFNVFAVTGNKSKLVFEKIPPKTLNKQINYIIDVEKPDKIKIDIYNDKGDYIDGNIYKAETKAVAAQTSFNGLGEAEINHLVDLRMAEKQKAAEHGELKRYTKELIEENEQLQAKIDELEELNQELQVKIESKSDLRYYAGMAGDILESFGISKEKLRKPLAELMGVEKEENQQKQIEAQKPDNSGIVEDEAKTPTISKEAEKRKETIEIISEYLHTTSTELLAHIFSICSDIEQDKSLAEYLIDCIKQRKEETDEHLRIQSQN